MKESVERIIEREGPNGLIIVKALYGKIDQEVMSRLEKCFCFELNKIGSLFTFFFCKNLEL
jgi:hypothetical protein